MHVLAISTGHKHRSSDKQGHQSAHGAGVGLCSSAANPVRNGPKQCRKKGKSCRTQTLPDRIETGSEPSRLSRGWRCRGCWGATPGSCWWRASSCAWSRVDRATSDRKHQSAPNQHQSASRAYHTAGRAEDRVRNRQNQAQVKNTCRRRRPQGGRSPSRTDLDLKGGGRGGGDVARAGEPAQATAEASAYHLIQTKRQ